MTDNGNGYYVLTTWASVSGANAATVRSTYKNTYGEQAIDSLGRMAKGINFGVLQDKMRDLLDDGASKTAPTMADLNSAILAAGGETPGVFSTALEVIGETATSVTDFSIGALKWLPIVLVVGGLVYLTVNAKALGLDKMLAGMKGAK